MSFIDEGMTDPSAGAYALTGGFCRSEERLMDHKYPSDEAERRRAKRSDRIPHCGPRQETSRYRERWA